MSHSPQNPRDLIQCPECKCSVRKDRLQQHLQKAHPYSEHLIRDIRHGWPRSAGSNADDLPESDEDSEERGVYEPDYETRFGDKHMGQWAHDSDGSFGSNPLYDDYGDESDAG